MASIEAAFKQFEKKIYALQELDQNGQSGFSREFQSLRQTSFKYKGSSSYLTNAGELPTNRVKNRFKDILPFDYSRVVLPSTNDDASDYINANFIKGVNGEKVYIASQGALPNTVNDFWRMLWAYKAKVVVMLCREEENGKKKCQRYWCEGDEEKLNFGGIVVKTERCIGVGNDFVMRTLVAEFQGEKLTITQFHYTAWPDHGVPPTALPLIKLIKLVREYQPDDSPPIVLHCSAGCGRTGTICALDYAQSLLKEMKYKDLLPYRIVENLRKQRHAMVQTKGQYEFLCRAMLCLFREKLDLPMEEDHDDHLYENVVPITPNSDSDSDYTPASPTFFDKTTHQTSNKKENSPSFSSAIIEHRGKAGVPQGTHSGPTQKRVGQLSEQNSGENYVNVSFDLVDISEDKPQSKSPEAAKPSSVNAHQTVPDRLSGKLPVSRKTSAPDYMAVEKSQILFEDTSTDYVVVPPRESQRTRRLLPSPTAYENVQPAPQKRPVVPSKPSITVSDTTSNYENVEVPNFASSSKSPRSSNQASTYPMARDRAAKPATPQKPPNYGRSQSSLLSLSAHSTIPAHQKFSSCGPKLGAKYAEQMKAMNGLQRARILPSEEKDSQEAEKAFPEQDVLNSSVYAAVNRSKSARKATSENALKGGDIVDGLRAPPVPKKSAELLVEVQQESNNDAKNKTLLLTKKIPFLSKKPEVKGNTLEHIGYGKRVPKPKGPRSPPKSWTVRS